MKKILIVIALLSVSYGIQAQVPNSLAFPSPNNSFLGKAAGSSGSASVNVNLYTGTALVNVPICNLSSKELAIPISLNYTAGRGVKVQDYATYVGLGWQLNVGGSISRVVRCFPDERSNGYLGTNLWGQVIAGYLGNGDPLTNAQYKAITGIDGTSYSYPTADGEPDIYYVKTPFFAFQFTFDENGNPVFSNSTGLKIIRNNFYNSSIYYKSSFEVIDDKGNQYYFGSSSQSKENATTKLFGTDYTFTTTWYLDKIVSYNSKDSILFHYTSPTSNDVTYHYQSSTSYDYPHSSHQNVDNTPIQTTISSPKVVSSIVSLLGEIDFSYAADRRDDANAPRLSNLVLKAYNPQTGINDIIAKTYRFNYSYFGYPAADPNLLRLRLDSVTISGNTTETSTPITLNSFTYNQETNLPSRKFLSAIDFFGYYSYTSSPNLYNISIPPNINYTKANILTGIKNLGGAYYQIFYELNTYYNTNNSGNVDVGGLRVKKISHTLPTGDDLYTKYIYNDNNGHSTGEILSNSYMINFWSSSCGIYKTVSESPANYYDINGNYIGYSSVKVLNQNGGYTIVNFSNFSTPGCNDILNYHPTDPYSIPDVTTSISSAYKRGLPLSTITYNASGDKISEDDYSYTSLTNPIIKASWAYHWENHAFRVSAKNYLNACNFGGSSTYWTKVENYRLTQTIHKDYDQNNPANYVQTTTNYTYAPNKRQIKSITTTDSKGNNHTQTFYYADDSSIPMVTSAEQTAISTMLNKNRISIPIHTIDNKNGIIHQVHYTYTAQPYGYDTRVYLNNAQYYTGSTLEKQQFFHYDATTSQLISSNVSNGKPTSVIYGYHSSLPIARLVNASNTVNYTNQVISQRKTYYVPPFNGGSYYTQFTSAATGTIKLAIPPGTYLGSNGGNGVTCFFSFYLSGPATKSGNLCNNSASNYDCSVPNSVSYTNMPAGTYTLNIMPSTNTSTVDVPFDYTFPVFNPSRSDSTEFFYEGFEEYPYVSYGNAHTGKAYWAKSSSYQAYFNPPNSRDYIIQWWSLSNGKWSMNEQPYTGPRSISGTIDDIRIFPSDARMTTYTYDPLIGKTGEIGPDGRTTTYEYDGLGRLTVTRDDNKNIISKIDYKYASQP